MKCISLWEPWATLCAVGAKQFETRSWATSHRGPILLHAAKRFTKSEQRTCFHEPFFSVLKSAGFLTEESDVRVKMKIAPGCIIGVANLAECYQVQEWEIEGRVGTNMVPWTSRFQYPDLAILVPSGNEFMFGDFAVGRFAWKLANPCRFSKPIPFRGMQQIFEVPDEVVAEQLAKARAA